MPASRPKQPDHQTKTTTAAPATPGHYQQQEQYLLHQQQHQQQRHSIVCSPQSSPTNSHLNRFITPTSSLTFGHSFDACLPSTKNVTKTTSSDSNENSRPQDAPDSYAVQALSNSVSASSVSSTSEHSTLINKNAVPLSSGKIQSQPQAQALSSQAQGQVYGHGHGQGQGKGQGQGQGQGQDAVQMIALTEARLYAQQLQNQQHHHHQYPGQQVLYADSSRFTAGGVGAATRSTIGLVASARGSTAASTVAGGMSPTLGGNVHSDEPAEQTLLLVRPVWVQDQDAAACNICARTFNAVRRKHHCRQCGRVLCHDCSARSIALPQLGYTKAVRVCTDCFEVAYLVAYCLSDDLGPSTQTYGARGLKELIETNDEKAIQAVLTYGGLDAVIYLCNMVHGHELHVLATTSLAVLAEYHDIQGVIVAKRAMPKLFHLVSSYAQHAIASVRPPSPPMFLTRMASTVPLNTKGMRHIEAIAVVLMNIAHIVFQTVPDKMLAKQLAKEGAIDSLMCLCVYFPAGVRTRAMEGAIRAMSAERDQSNNTGEDDTSSHSQVASFDNHNQQSVQEEGEALEETLISMDENFHTQLENMQGLAAKCISIIVADVSNQAFIVDDPERIDRLVQLLYSNNADVIKYASKTMAYLSLRNDRYKPDIVKGSGAAALIAVIHTASTAYDHGPASSEVLAEAVSHACCALANLATNTESQEILMSHVDLLNVTCAVVGLFSHQREIERHVARLIANLALYDQNKLALLTAYSTAYSAPSDNMPLDLSYSAHHGQHQSRSGFPNRYSSPSPLARRAKSNVIPTLLQIGALTLQKAAYPIKDQEVEEPYPRPGQQDAIDFMNDEDHMADQTANPGYITPNDSSSEQDVSGQDDHDIVDPLASSIDGGSSNADHRHHLSEWTTVPGMEDVQRHIIRAIDNLMTSVAEDPTSHQSFKVFSRIWPTIGLIKTIQLTNQDEDTQRRAMHVLSTLIQQQEIHAEAMDALRQQTLSAEQSQHQQSLPMSPSLQPGDSTAAAAIELKKEMGLQRAKEAEEANEASKAAAATAEAERAAEMEKRANQKRIKEERREQERLDQERLEQERLEQERFEQERLEQERLEQERLEQERFEQERLEQDRLEQKRLKQERLKQERLEHERLEHERLEQERLEQERLEQERLEQERLEQERLEQERLDNELQEQERLHKETLVRLALEQTPKDEIEDTEQSSKDEKDAMSGSETSQSGPSGSKTPSISEDQTTSQDEAPKRKSKKKKKSQK